MNSSRTISILWKVTEQMNTKRYEEFAYSQQQQRKLRQKRFHMRLKCEDVIADSIAHG